MPKTTFIPFFVESSDYPMQSRYRIEKLGFKSCLMTGTICLLSLLSQQSAEGEQVVPSTPVLIESRSHYSFTTPYAEYAGSSENTMIERRLSSEQYVEDYEGAATHFRDVVTPFLHRPVTEKTRVEQIEAIESQ